MTRRFLSARARGALVAVALVAAAAAIGPAPAAAEAMPQFAVCESRACLVLLAMLADRDGDGVADEDEVLLGTDPDDAQRTPDPAKLLDVLLARQLPSFEHHLTELVLLPTLTPDGLAIATGLGEFKLRDGDANLLKSIGIVVTELGENGFDDIFGLKITGAKREEPTYGFDNFTSEKAQWDSKHNRALYSNGTTSGVASYGYNAGKVVASENLGTDTNVFITYGDNGVTTNYQVNYTDGSHDAVTESHSNDASGTHDSADVRSYDSDGNYVGDASIARNVYTDADGTKVTKMKFTGPTKDSTGAVTGTKEIKVRMEETGDTTKTVVTTKTTDNDGNVKVEEKINIETCDEACRAQKEQKKPDTEQPADEYIDPDYIGFEIVTPEDMARVEFRIKQISKPVPDNGDTEDPVAEPPTYGQCWPNCGGDPLLVLMDPDGVTVIGAGGEPNFNKRVQPDYVPRLEALSGLAAQPVPVK